VANSYHNIGIILKNKGEYDKALEYYEKSLAIKLKTLGGEHTDVAHSYNNIGLIWKNKGEYEKALEHYVLSSQIRFKKLGASHNLTITSIESAKRLAKELGKANELPDWMKEIN
jgi:tetratricopeptide (TPR) repeat protein